MKFTNQSRIGLDLWMRTKDTGLVRWIRTRMQSPLLLLLVLLLLLLLLRRVRRRRYCKILRNLKTAFVRIRPVPRAIHNSQKAGINGKESGLGHNCPSVYLAIHSTTCSVSCFFSSSYISFVCHLCTIPFHILYSRVGNRYKKYGGKCITPELMKETGETWAISGPGSTLAATKEVRTLLATLFADPTLQIRTFLDCPCGDWLWMQAVDLSSVHYFGADITEETVRENTKCFAQETVQFATLDWSCAIPPPVDLIMIRDVLFHLSTANNLDILRHVNASGAKYLLTTTFPNKSHAAVDNYDIGPKVGFRNINLYGPPYNFPDPPLRKTGVEVAGGRREFYTTTLYRRSY